jgi:hypothetical protein
MYYVLSKDIIESEIICHLPVRKEGLSRKLLLVKSLIVFFTSSKRVFNGIYYLWRVYSVLMFFITKLFLGIIVDGVKRDLAKMLDRTFEKV